jgi:transposase
MRKPIFVRPLTEEEQQTLQAGLRSADAFVLRRCQILLASARGQRAPQIAQAVGCHEQTVRNVLHAFNCESLRCLERRSRRPHKTQAAFNPDQVKQLRELLHQSPRTFDKPYSLWTLGLAAEVAFAQGLTVRLVSGETIRATLEREGIRWRRAKHWITSPDPAYERKKKAAID